MLTEPVWTEPRALPPPPTNPAVVYLESLASGQSRITQAWALAVVSGFLLPGSTVATFPWRDVRGGHVQALRTFLMGRYAPGTGNRILAAVRGVLRAAWGLGLLTLEELTRTCNVKTIRGRRKPPGREVPVDETEALFAAAAADENSQKGLRDAALLAILFGAGLRRSEITGLDLCHVVYRGGRIILETRGKGDKERSVPLGRRAAEAVHAYLERVRGDEPGPLFFGRHGKRRMNPGSIPGILDSLAERARIPRLAPHDCRRTYVGQLFDAKADAAAMKGLVGHEQFVTTIGYDRRGERARIDAADLVIVPYVPRSELDRVEHRGGQARTSSASSVRAMGAPERALATSSAPRREIGCEARSQLGRSPTHPCLRGTSRRAHEKACHARRLEKTGRGRSGQRQDPQARPARMRAGD